MSGSISGTVISRRLGGDRSKAGRLLSPLLAVFFPALLFMGAALAQSPLPKPANNSDGPPITFYALLSADEQSAYTESPGVGRVEFTLERPTLKLSWTVTYSKLTSAPVGLGMHGPQTPGGNAGLLIDMAPKGLSNPMKGSIILNDGQLEYLLTGRIYVNLRTEKYKAGELRGQVMRLPPGKTIPQS